MAQPQVHLAHLRPDVERINIGARLAFLVARELLEPPVSNSLVNPCDFIVLRGYWLGDFVLRGYWLLYTGRERSRLNQIWAYFGRCVNGC